MSATITAPRPSSASHLTTAGILRSEWIKLRSVRSTVWSYAIIVVVSLGMALLMSTTFNFGGATLPAEQHVYIVMQASTFGIYFGQLIVAVLGVLIISGEYSTGMIRSTLTAVPKRIPALAAKALVLFVDDIRRRPRQRVRLLAHRAAPSRRAGHRGRLLRRNTARQPRPRRALSRARVGVRPRARHRPAQQRRRHRRCARHHPAAPDHRVR